MPSSDQGTFSRKIDDHWTRWNVLIHEKTYLRKNYRFGIVFLNIWSWIDWKQKNSHQSKHGRNVCPFWEIFKEMLVIKLNGKLHRNHLGHVNAFTGSFIMSAWKFTPQLSLHFGCYKCNDINTVYCFRAMSKPFYAPCHSVFGIYVFYFPPYYCWFAVLCHKKI